MSALYALEEMDADRQGGRRKHQLKASLIKVLFICLMASKAIIVEADEGDEDNFPAKMLLEDMHFSPSGNIFANNTELNVTANVRVEQGGLLTCPCFGSLLFTSPLNCLSSFSVFVSSLWLWWTV